MKRLKDFKFREKNVLVRCDLNVPISETGEVLDDFRIKMTLPTIEYLIKKKAKVVLMSHLEKKGKNISLVHVIPTLERLLNQKVEFLSDYLAKDVRGKIEKMPLGKVILLENLRFHKGEKKNDKEFAKKISSLGDFFINEAFLFVIGIMPLLQLFPNSCLRQLALC